MKILWIALFDLSCYVFLRSVHTFSWFLKPNWSSDFGHAETGNGAKSEWFCCVKFFRSSFEAEWENGAWTNVRFLASGFLFTCGNITWIFTVYPIFYLIFFIWFCQFTRSPSRSSFFVKSMKIHWILRQDLSCYVFCFVVKIFVTTKWRHNQFKSAFCSIVHAISTGVTSFFVLSGVSFFVHLRD